MSVERFKMIYGDAWSWTWWTTAPINFSKDFVEAMKNTKIECDLD